MISVVIPLYNKEKCIYATLQSVCEQTYADTEIIVVDDGSTDNSAAVAASYPDTRIRVIRKENGGVCSARNRGIREAKSEFVALLPIPKRVRPPLRSARLLHRGSCSEASRSGRRSSRQSGRP